MTPPTRDTKLSPIAMEERARFNQGVIGFVFTAILLIVLSIPVGIMWSNRTQTQHDARDRARAAVEQRAYDALEQTEGITDLVLNNGFATYRRNDKLCSAPFISTDPAYIYGSQPLHYDYVVLVTGREVCA